MNRFGARAVLSVAMVLAWTGSCGQIVGRTVGVARDQTEAFAIGRSVRKHLLEQVIYTEQGDKIGTVHDLIVSADGTISFVVVSADDLVGLNRHHVLIPIDQLRQRQDRLLLPGMTRASIQALPAFEYAD